MQFSKYSLTLASIAAVSVFALAPQSFAADKSEDSVERSESAYQRIDNKMKALDAEVREHTRKDDTQEDKAERAARVAKIKQHFADLDRDLNALEDRAEAERNKVLDEARAKMAELKARMAQDDTKEDASERAARAKKIQDIEDYIENNAKNDWTIVRTKLHALGARIEEGDSARDAAERQERQAKFQKDMAEIRADFKELHAKLHAKKDWFRINVLGIGVDRD